MILQKIRAREGDFIETVDNLFFDVKGLVHPPNRIVAYLRYIQDATSDRSRRNVTYKKIYSLNERERLLEKKYPQYVFYDPVFGERLEGVPFKNVLFCYQPIKKVSELTGKNSFDEVEKQAIEFIRCLHESSGVSYKKLGLSGSILIGLHNDQSDIDPIVYGRKNCLVLYEALKELKRKKGGIVSSYGIDGLKNLYDFRSRDDKMPWREFHRIERRKVSHGRFKGRDFSLRFIVDWNEVNEEYGDRKYVSMGYARIKARIQDDSDSIFTPCSYKVTKTEVLEGVKDSLVEEIVSFRSRFCEQAVKGETVVAQGKVERVTDKHENQRLRLILGSHKTDFMIGRSFD